MSADNDLEARLRSRLRAELDAAEVPSRRWDDIRVTKPPSQRGRDVLRPLLLLAAAIAVGSIGTIMLTGGRLPVVQPGPTPVPSPVASGAFASPAPSGVPTAAPSTVPSSSPVASGASPSPGLPAVPGQPWAITGTSDGWTVATVPSDTLIGGIEDLGGGLVLGSAAGSNLTPPGGAPVVWRWQGSHSHPAGIDFSLEPLPLASSHLSWLTPNVAATDGTRIVLGAGGSTDLCAHPFGGGGWAWDGTRWVAKPFVMEVDCSAIPSAIVHGPLGFVETTIATGEVYGIWRSTDGLAWTKVAPPESGFLQLTSVALIGGRYVVAGRGTDGSAHLWSTVDLRTWHRTVLSSGSGDLPTVVATPTLAVASAIGQNGNMVRWTSHDGVTWTEVMAPMPTSPTTGVAIVRDRLVVAGPMGSRAAVWTSPDAVTWRPALLPADIPADAAFGPIGVLGSELVVVVRVDSVTTSTAMALLRPWPLP